MKPSSVWGRIPAAVEDRYVRRDSPHHTSQYLRYDAEGRRPFKPVTVGSCGGLALTNSRSGKRVCNGSPPWFQVRPEGREPRS
jgi:hypothetical protein